MKFKKSECMYFMHFILNQKKKVSTSLKLVASSIKSMKSGRISSLALLRENFFHLTLQLPEYDRWGAVWHAGNMIGMMWRLENFSVNLLMYVSLVWKLYAEFIENVLQNIAYLFICMMYVNGRRLFFDTNWCHIRLFSFSEKRHYFYS